MGATTAISLDKWRKDELDIRILRALGSIHGPMSCGEVNEVRTAYFSGVAKGLAEARNLLNDKPEKESK